MKSLSISSPHRFGDVIEFVIPYKSGVGTIVDIVATVSGGVYYMAMVSEIEGAFGPIYDEDILTGITIRAISPVVIVHSVNYLFGEIISFRAPESGICCGKVVEIAICDDGRHYYHCISERCESHLGIYPESIIA